MFGLETLVEVITGRAGEAPQVPQSESISVEVASEPQMQPGEPPLKTDYVIFYEHNAPNVKPGHGCNCLACQRVFAAKERAA